MVKLRNGYRCRMVALPIGSVAEWYRCRIASVAEWNVAEWIVAEWLSCRMVELPNGIVAEVCCGIYNNLYKQMVLKRLANSFGHIISS